MTTRRVIASSSLSELDGEESVACVAVISALDFLEGGSITGLVNFVIARQWLMKEYESADFYMRCGCFRKFVILKGDKMMNLWFFPSELYRKNKNKKKIE